MNEGSQQQEGWTFNGIKMPLVLKDQTIFDAGVWNGYLYDTKVVKNIFDHTDWTDSDRLAIYRDHRDGSVDGKSGLKNVSDWVGRLSNPRFVEIGKIIGDVEIWDGNMATLLNYAKPKFGISASVFSQFSGNAVFDGFIRNNSIVINPAVKTAYINNSEVMSDELEFAEVTAMEEKKILGMSPGEFYAIPREPPSASKLPIFDAAHVRNALARYNQISGVSAEEKISALQKIRAAAEKFDIEIGNKNNNEGDLMSGEAEVKNLSEEDVKKIVADAVKNNLMDEDMKKKKMMEEEERKKMEEQHKKEQMDMMQKVNQMSDEIKTKDIEIKNLNDKLSQPARLSAPQVPSSEQVKFQDVDEGMANLIENLRKENTISM